MSLALKVPQQPRRILPLPEWPAADRDTWIRARKGTGPEWRDNPAYLWSQRTLEKNEDGYGRYLAWLEQNGCLIENEPVPARVSPERVTEFIKHLKSQVAPVSVGIYMGSLCAAAQALAPEVDRSWLSIRFRRLKLRARPSRDKRSAIQHTLDLYLFGKQVMDSADQRRDKRSRGIAAALRYQAGLIIALLAARPLRIRNFQAITVGKSLRWDGARYWLTFGPDETKTGRPIDEPVPDDLIPYLERFLNLWRPLLLRQGPRFGNAGAHARLWVDRTGKPMEEPNMRALIKSYTERKFGTALWPHLFRDCLLTSVAVDQPDLVKISATLLGHGSLQTGEKHYNQAHMLDASRRYGMTILQLQEKFLAGLRCEPEDTP